MKHTTSPGLTRTGIFVGTVEYAAPEQIEGRPLDGRTDVYALGCVLYECLTAKPPFDREAEVAVMHAHLTEPPPSLTEARPDLPPGLNRVVATAMAKPMEERFATCPQLVDASRAAVLERHPAPAERRSTGPVPESPPPTPEVVSPPPTPEVVSPPGPAPVSAAVEPPAAAFEEPAAPAGRGGRSQWVVYALIALAAAALSGGIVLFAASGDDSESPSAAASGAAGLPAQQDLRLEDLVPSQIWNACALQNTPRPGAVESAVCQPAQTGSPGRTPDRLDLSLYPDARTVTAAYRAERDGAGVRSAGRCDGASWAGEGEWFHSVAAGAPTKPGGDRFCFFDGDDAVIVWTHRQLAQETHREMLLIAREGAVNHAGLFSWWRFWRHNIGKTR